MWTVIATVLTSKWAVIAGGVASFIPGLGPVVNTVLSFALKVAEMLLGLLVDAAKTYQGRCVIAACVCIVAGIVFVKTVEAKAYNKGVAVTKSAMSKKCQPAKSKQPQELNLPWPFSNL